MDSSDRGVLIFSVSFITSLLRVTCFSLLLFSCSSLVAQTVVVRGKVLNVRTNAAVEFSNVLLVSTLIKRLTYLDRPALQGYGIRFRMKFDV